MASKSSKPNKNVIFEQEPMDNSENNDMTESKPSTIENIISVALGLAVVFVIGAMIVNVIKNRNSGPATNTEDQAAQEQSATISAMYTVQAGDTLWSIAEQFYKDGFKYPEIEKANNMNENSHLEKGMQLIIPKVEGTAVEPTKGTSPAANSPVPSVEVSKAPESATAPPVPTSTLAPSPLSETKGPTGPTGSQETGKGETSSASTDRQYTVVKGDTLWDISVKRYNNGYRWVEIARMNGLKHPDVIHPGNVLLMP